MGKFKPLEEHKSNPPKTPRKSSNPYNLHVLTPKSNKIECVSAKIGEEGRREGCSRVYFEEGRWGNGRKERTRPKKNGITLFDRSRVCVRSFEQRPKNYSRRGLNGRADYRINVNAFQVSTITMLLTYYTTWIGHPICTIWSKLLKKYYTLHCFTSWIHTIWVANFKSLSPNEKN